MASKVILRNEHVLTQSKLTRIEIWNSSSGCDIQRKLAGV
jgi:hypothetical protein